MPHEVIMPALGMAQDSGVLVAWLKSAGDPVKAGDALMEVETDKATMEVEAAHDGYLTDVRATEGEAVPVGNVVALISETPEGSGDTTPAAAPSTAPSGDAAAPADALPEGRQIIMPALGMAQDSALIVGWSVKPGDKVSADDVLLEVETDKSTMEVPAGHDGYLAAVLAAEGEDVPVGEVIAIISTDKPDTPVQRCRADSPAAAPSGKEEAPAQEAGAAKPPAADPTPEPAARPAAVAATGGRILASPKARWLAAQEGLDLSRLVAAGIPQPFHVSDLDTLRAMPADTAAPATQAAGPAQCLTAELPAQPFDDFAAWLGSETGQAAPRAAALAGFAAAALFDATGTPGAVSVENTSTGHTECFDAAPGDPLGALTAGDATPALTLRDLAQTAITGVQLGVEATPVLSVMRQGDSLRVTLGARMPPSAAITLLNGFAARLTDPLRHIL